MAASRHDRVNRRRFLQLAGSSAGVLTFVASAGNDDEATAAFAELEQAIADGLSGSLRVLRPRDLVDLRFDFLNLRPQRRFLSTPVLEPVDAGRPSFLAVTLPGQHVLEERSLSSEPAPDIPLSAFLSAPTTLVFRVGADRIPLEYRLDSLLRWQDFELVSRPAGLPMCRPGKESAIVFPSRLAFVPDAAAVVRAPRRPRVVDGRAELWRADVETAALRAIWTPDQAVSGCGANGPAPPAFDAPLQAPGDRVDIVRSARRPTTANPSAAPVVARRLALSSLGAWADVRGAWDPPASSDLVEWENRTIMGRDQRVKVVRSGYLYPWGHKAALVDVTEREILASPAGGDAAYLRQRFHLVITQPVRTYPHPDDSADLGVPTLPLRSIAFVTTKTPTLDAWRPDGTTAVPDGNIGDLGGRAFWPKVGGVEFRFAIETRDWKGRLASTDVTGIFVGLGEAHDGRILAEIERAYAEERSSTTGTPHVEPGLRTSRFRGQPVALAVEGERDDTTLNTSTMTFGGVRRRGAAGGGRDWPFSAVLSSASVRIPAVSFVAGYGGELDVGYDDRFDPVHPEANPAELYLKVNNSPHLNFAALGADKSGGVATPNMKIGAISRTNGPVGDNVDAIALGDFEPDGFFPDDAKLLGGVKMGDVLAKSPVVTTDSFCDGSPGGSRSSMPKFGVSYEMDDQDSGGGVEGEHKVCFLLDWQTNKLKSFNPAFEVGPDSCLRLQTTVCIGGESKIEATQQRGRITDCKFTIPKVVRLHFEYFDFERVEGRPLRFDVKFAEKDGLELLDALKWIHKLISAIKSFVGGLFGGGKGGGIGDYFDYDISPLAVKLFFALKIPDLELNALTLSNMKLRLGIELPLLGDDGTLIIVEFCTRKDPFGITVPPFGGGGFFGIGFVTDELRRVEGAFEFGGRFEPNIIGAKGEVYVMAGVYYGMKVIDGANRHELAAYLRAGGSMKIIRLVHISVEFYLVLMYIADESSPDDNSLCGEATVKVEVSIGFFSAGVSLNFRKCFRGSDTGADTDTASLIGPVFIAAAHADANDERTRLTFATAVNGREGWNEYWKAFAL